MKRIEYSSSDNRLNQQILQLLAECFGPQYHDYYLLQLEHLPSPKTTKILGNDRGDIIAFTQVVEYLYRTGDGKAPLRAAYLYSVCTAKAEQGKGVMKHFIKEILEELAAEGYAMAFLVPAEIWLIDYYKRLGFKWEATDVYAKLPRDTTPLIYPGEAAKEYLEAVRKIERQTISQAKFEAQKQREWQPLVPPVLGWMSYPLTEKPPQLPPTFLLLPLT